MTNPKPVYLAFDTETSTGDKRTAFILSLGAMVLDKDLQVIDKIKLLIKPDPQPNGQDGTLVVEPEAMGVNKIDLVAHFKDPETLPLSEACVKFSEFMFKYVDFKRVPIGNPRFGKTKFVCKNPLIPVGQNYRFDKDVIAWTLLREFEACVTNRGIDTGSNGEFLRLCGLLPTVGSLSLSKQAELAGVMQELVNKAHDALVDTELSVWVLQWQKSLVTRLAAVEPPAPSKPVMTPETLASKHIVWAQEWETRDSWSGPESDGFWLFLTGEAATNVTAMTLRKMRASEAERYGGRTPEVYSTPTGRPFEVFVPEELYKKIVNAVEGVHVSDLAKAGVERGFRRPNFVS